MKYIMFSRKFPKGHPKQGQDTNFIQKIWKAINVPLPVSVDADKLEDEVHKLMFNEWLPKYHTIRAGHRFKAGEYFSPRVWTGKPYASKQIIIADPIQVVKTFDFEMDDNGIYSINGKYVLDDPTLKRLAINDGLTQEDMWYWFMPNYNKPKPFDGQIICWNDKVEY